MTPPKKNVTPKKRDPRPEPSAPQPSSVSSTTATTPTETEGFVAQSPEDPSEIPLPRGNPPASSSRREAEEDQQMAEPDGIRNVPEDWDEDMGCRFLAGESPPTEEHVRPGTPVPPTGGTPRARRQLYQGPPWSPDREPADAAHPSQSDARERSGRQSRRAAEPVVPQPGVAAGSNMGGGIGFPPPIQRQNAAHGAALDAAVGLDAPETPSSTVPPGRPLPTFSRNVGSGHSRPDGHVRHGQVQTSSLY